MSADVSFKQARDPNFGANAIKQAKKRGGDLDKVRQKVLFYKAMRTPWRFLRRKMLAASLAASDRTARLDPAAGWLSMPAGFSPLVPEVIRAAEAVFAQRSREPEFIAWREQRRTEGKKYHFMNLLNEAELLVHPEFMELALSRPVLALVADYLGMVPKLQGVQLWWTQPNDTVTSSQQYHIDEFDERQVKFILHIRDVDELSGPFTLLRSDVSDRVREQLGHVSGRLTDEQVYSIVPESEAVVGIGPAGTCLAVDTCRALHYGSRARGKDRLVMMFHFSAYAEIVEVGQPVPEVVRRRFATDTIRRLVCDV